MSDKYEEFKVQLQKARLFSECGAENDEQMMEAVRNNVEYGRQWTRVYNALEKISPNWMEEVFTDGELRGIFEVISEKAHFAIPSNASLQGDIMDNLMLVAQAARVNYHDDWLDEIWLQYQQGKFPHLTYPIH